MDELIARQWYALFSGVELALTIVGAVYAAFFIIALVALGLQYLADKAKKEEGS